MRHQTDASRIAPDPTRSAWLAVALSIIALAGGMVCLEIIHRSEYLGLLKRAPAAWSDPQVRRFSESLSLASLAEPKRSAAAMRWVALMRESGELTAMAWWQYGLLGAPGDGQDVRCEAYRNALLAAPDTSPRLAMFLRVLSRELVRSGRADEVGGLLRATIQRPRDTQTQARLLAAAMGPLTHAGHPEEALRLHTSTLASYPQLAGQDRVRLVFGRALAAAGRKDQAREVLAELLHADSPRVRERAQAELRALRGARSDDH